MAEGQQVDISQISDVSDVSAVKPKPVAIGSIEADSTMTLISSESVEAPVNEKKESPPKPMISFEHFADLETDSESEHITQDQIKNISTKWFQTFDQKDILQKIEEDAAFTTEESELASKSFVEGILTTLVRESVKRGGGAVARTAKLFPELIKTYSVSAFDVQKCLSTYTKSIKDAAEANPNICKYFGIFYGVLLAENESDFGLPLLANILSDLIQDDAEHLYMLKIMSQVLGAVQVIKSDTHLVEMYQRQKFDLQQFWPSGHQNSESVTDFLENNSLECLMEYQSK
ncbi:UNVERIFIED_CONTAM: hypothetical protein HDU68_011076 [Siphonaria sp. JEL0065]|nr:hypothetical protein HDU68_011076 [Siphonaria sp. JEL0065]